MFTSNLRQQDDAAAKTPDISSAAAIIDCLRQHALMRTDSIGVASYGALRHVPPRLPTV